VNGVVGAIWLIAIVGVKIATKLGFGVFVFNTPFWSNDRLISADAFSIDSCVVIEG